MAGSGVSIEVLAAWSLYRVSRCKSLAAREGVSARVTGGGMGSGSSWPKRDLPEQDGNWSEDRGLKRQKTEADLAKDRAESGGVDVATLLLRRWTTVAGYHTGQLNL